MFIVLVMVMLSSLLVIWASRTALFSEMITGNDSDYQRAFEAAQAMVRDAEFDIMGTLSDGRTECRRGAAYVGCRDLSGGIFFPADEADFQNLSDSLRKAPLLCVRGICLANDGKFLNSQGDLEAMKKVAATYGAHTGAKATAASNPLLMTGAGQEARAWYWVEVLPYDVGAATAAGPAQRYAPDAGSPYVFRITAIAKGLKPNSLAVVQTVFVRKRMDS